tara:strand:+ start:156875 stop:157153 length:279 start_codon:yes stop_codon:yes gene_type:complete
MKKVILASGVLFLMASCSSNENDCHECHIAYLNSNNVEIEYELGEFCATNLQDLESNGYNLTEQQVVGTDTIPAAMYPASDIHCEEHHDDDH